jgi:hypothetical protein
MTTLYLGPDRGPPRGLMIWVNRIVAFHQIRVQGFYTRGRPKHSRIPCGVLGGIILTSNHRVTLKISFWAFPRSVLSTWLGMDSFHWIMNNPTMKGLFSSPHFLLESGLLTLHVRRLSPQKLIELPQAMYKVWESSWHAHWFLSWKDWLAWSSSEDKIHFLDSCSALFIRVKCRVQSVLKPTRKSGDSGVEIAIELSKHGWL